MWWTNAPATLPHGGRQPVLERLPVLAREEAVLEPDVDVVPRQARRRPGSCRGTSRGRCRRRRSASSQTSSLSCSSHESKRAPSRYARSSTSRERAIAAREDALEPRASSPSCVLEVDARRAAPRRGACCCLRATSSSVSIAHHWKGVCGFGTCVETLTVTSARRRCAASRLPTARARAAGLDDAAHVLVRPRSAGRS